SLEESISRSGLAARPRAATSGCARRATMLAWVTRIVRTTRQLEQGQRRPVVLSALKNPQQARPQARRGICLTETFGHFFHSPRLPLFLGQQTAARDVGQIFVQCRFGI